MSAPDLTVRIGSLTMKNPVTTGSGTFGFGSEVAEFVDLEKFGAITVKATTREKRLGNPPTRMVETSSGILNAIGLQNGGIEDYLQYKAPFLRKFAVPIIVNVPGESPDDFALVARKLTEAQAADAIELNISCPNVSHGLDYATDPKLTAEVVSAVRKVTSLPVLAKLSPNVADIRPIARAAEDAGADGLSLINTVIGTAIDIRKRKFRLANVTGGLSGPAIKPIALLHVYRAASVVKIPLIGMGGIRDAADAIEFLLAGASAVAVGTQNFVNPAAGIEIAVGIEKYLADNGFGSVAELVGALEDKLMPYKNLPIGDNAPEEVNAVIEIPRGSSNKYEYDSDLGVFKLDRPLYSPLFYPCDYGWIAGTMSADGDPLDVLVIGSHPTFCGCVVTCRPLGVLMMRDEKGADEKILARVAHDPRFHGVRRLSHLSEHVLKEIEHFFEIYKTLEKKPVQIGEWKDVEAAQELINTCRMIKNPTG